VGHIFAQTCQATYSLGFSDGRVGVLYVRRSRVTRWQHGHVNHLVVDVNHTAVVCHAQCRQHVVPCIINIL